MTLIIILYQSHKIFFRPLHVHCFNLLKSINCCSIMSCPVNGFVSVVLIGAACGPCCEMHGTWRASAGHDWNQSIVQQLTSDGNLRSRFLKASPMGLIASTTCS